MSGRLKNIGFKNPNPPCSTRCTPLNQKFTTVDKVIS